LFKRIPRFRTNILLFLVLSIFLGAAHAAEAGEIRAFSLREANRLLSQGKNGEGRLNTMAGITRFAGMVFDEENSDIILVGRVSPQLPPVTIDDFIVALRSRLQGKDYPRVSIDRVEHTDKSRLQDVRFDGGIQKTGFGYDFLQSDIVLKKYSLDLLTGITGIKPYLKHYEQSTKQKLKKENQSIATVNWYSEEESKEVLEKQIGSSVKENSMAQSRFWFHVRPDKSFIVERDGVYVIEELSLGVKAETIVKETEDNDGKRKDGGRDEAAEAFADEFTVAFTHASEKHKVLQRLKALFDLVAISEGIYHLDNRPSFEWLERKHAIKRKNTPQTYRLISRVGEFRTKEKVASLVELSGGIELEAILLALEDGDVSALRTAVVESRPSPNTLSWRIPLDTWTMPNDISTETVSASENSPLQESGTSKKLGFGLTVQRYVFDEKPSTKKFNGFPIPPPMPPWKDIGSIPQKLDKMLSSKERESPEIGGVMLSNTASIIGESNGPTLTNGNFSFILKGLLRDKTPSNFRKFITALWAVYYSKEDPGISIDPIAWGVDKQLVRYIGRVINTDLGRVMREADYLMKKWAVGTEQADIPGFRDVDTIEGDDGLTYADAARRFWFVPEDMTFKVSNGMFLFEKGRMTLKTELMVSNRTTQVVESDRIFAKFFTENYDDIAGKYPIYKDLMEYAKLVSIAKYMKQQGVPLHWFLMAHLDDVITEDSKGTVETLSKGSKYLKDVRIEGGVEMNGNYVLDHSAAAAISQALSRLRQPERRLNNTISTFNENIPDAIDVDNKKTFSMDQQVFSVLPTAQSSVSEDLHGIHYKTDVAIRQGSEPGLEIVRYFKPPVFGIHSKGEFGKGWHLLRPYRLVPVGEPEVPFLNILVPQKVAVRNLITGEDEILTFDDKRYELSGYRPTDMAKSRIVGVFWTVSGGMRLVDKLGNEFWFDSDFQLSEMHLSDEFGVRFEYGYEEASPEFFEKTPYRLVRDSEEIVEDVVFYHASGAQNNLPKKLKFTCYETGASRVFTYGENNNGFLGYSYDPSDPLKNAFIALRQDGTHILVDANGNEIWFNHNLHFIKYRPLLIKAVIQGMYAWNNDLKDIEFLGNHAAQLKYEFSNNFFRVKEINVFGKEQETPVASMSYQYENDAFLADVTNQ